MIGYFLFIGLLFFIFGIALGVRLSVEATKKLVDEGSLIIPEKYKKNKMEVKRLKEGHIKKGGVNEAPSIDKSNIKVSPQKSK